MTPHLTVQIRNKLVQAYHDVTVDRHAVGSSSSQFTKTPLFLRHGASRPRHSACSCAGGNTTISGDEKNNAAAAGGAHAVRRSGA
jgi:hypothetical protein